MADCSALPWFLHLYVSAVRTNRDVAEWRGKKKKSIVTLQLLRTDRWHQLIWFLFGSSFSVFFVLNLKRFLLRCRLRITFVALTSPHSLALCSQLIDIPDHQRHRWTGWLSFSAALALMHFIPSAGLSAAAIKHLTKTTWPDGDSQAHTSSYLSFICCTLTTNFFLLLSFLPCSRKSEGKSDC